MIISWDQRFKEIHVGNKLEHNWEIGIIPWELRHPGWANFYEKSTGTSVLRCFSSPAKTMRMIHSYQLVIYQISFANLMKKIQCLSMMYVMLFNKKILSTETKLWNYVCIQCQHWIRATIFVHCHCNLVLAQWCYWLMN